MVITAARIERLWKACPELQPGYIANCADHPMLCQTSSGAWSWLGGWGGHDISPDIAHALIRDSITRWLAKRHGEIAELIGLIFFMQDEESYTLRAVLAAERVLGLEDCSDIA